MADDDDTATPGAQRIDKWLWQARAVKSRTLAAALVSEGRVRINRARVTKPSHAVKPGDVITAGVGARIRVLEVVGIGDRRGPASEAQALYRDLTPPPTPATAAPSVPVRDAGSGRPTKRDRRQLDRLTGRDDTE